MRSAAVFLVLVLTATSCSQPAPESTPPAGSDTPTTQPAAPAPTAIGATMPPTTDAVVSDPLADPEFVAWATDYGLLNPDGYFGPVDEDGVPFRLDPIGGYADFSSLTPQEVFDLDLVELSALLQVCVLDQNPDFAVAVDGQGTFQLTRLSPALRDKGFATYIACREGLQLPAASPWTDEQWSEAYAYLMAQLDCEESYGADWGERISIDDWKAKDASWEYTFDPYATLAVPLADLQRDCPSNPLGGFGTWDPGDPITPLP